MRPERQDRGFSARTLPGAYLIELERREDGASASSGITAHRPAIEVPISYEVRGSRVLLPSRD